jgi:hypothetical protein
MPSKRGPRKPSAPGNREDREVERRVTTVERVCSAHDLQLKDHHARIQHLEDSLSKMKD